MIHEVLFALFRYPNYLQDGIGEDRTCVDPTLNEFLHPGEINLYNKIMRIAKKHSEIDEFCKVVMDQDIFPKDETTINQSNIERSGLYLKAFCNGVDEVLDGYRKGLVELEATIMKNPQLSLTYVYANVEKFDMLFDCLKSMIEMIKTDNIFGCLLFGRLHIYTNYRVSLIEKSVSRIIKSINTKFYRHLANWIVYGDLSSDIFNEFFITDCKCDDENFLFPDQIGPQDTKTSFTNIKSSRICKPCPVRKFVIVPEMLPSILPLDTAETILFLGRIVWIVSNDPKDNSNVQKQKFRRDLWEGNSFEFYEKIQKLEMETFNKPQFEKIIQESKLRLTNYLSGVMLDEADLLGHLQIIRDYYGLGRGELFQQFIVIAEEHLKQAPNDFILKNLNTIFNDTARKMYGENDKTFMKFELTMPRNLEPKSYAKNPLSNLEIYFDISWPLHIIFHPKVIMLYNKLFSFLLRLKKTHIDLHVLWLNQVKSKGKIDCGVWSLRHNLMFIVNNLQYYLQVDVIESHFSMFKRAVKTASEYKDILRLHSTFLSHIMSQTFVLSLDDKYSHDKRHSLYQLPLETNSAKNIVHSLILQLLELCDDFCMLASTWNADLLDTERQDLVDFKERSDIIIESLLRALYSLHNKGHHLLQLLHRLDFNRWYTKDKTDFNITTQ